jgi:hypothetical protein
MFAIATSEGPCLLNQRLEPVWSYRGSGSDNLAVSSLESRPTAMVTGHRNGDVKFVDLRTP